VRCGADDRQALEQLCRYITRPAFANECVQTNAAGQVVLKLKTPWRDGTTHLVMSPLEFMQRLAALEPRPRLPSRMTATWRSILLARCPVWVGGGQPLRRSRCRIAVAPLGPPDSRHSGKPGIGQFRSSDWPESRSANDRFQSTAAVGHRCSKVLALQSSPSRPCGAGRHPM